MNYLTKDQILGADDREFKTVDVPQWGGSVCLASMTGAERDQFEADMLDEKGKSKKGKLKNFRARYVSHCIVNSPEDPTRTFSEADIAALGAKHAGALAKLFDEATAMNGTSQADVEELEGN